MIHLGNGVYLVTRAEWGARAPKTKTSLRPTFGSTVHWEGPHMGNFPHSSCATKVRGIQAFHMNSRGWSDIAYSGIVCPHNYVYEGRWMGVRTAANGTSNGNNSAYAFCYLGGQRDGFTGQLAMRTVLDYADRNSAGPGRNCHRDWKSTECPGDHICGWVKTGQPAGGITPPQPKPPTTPKPPTDDGEELTVAQIEELKKFIAERTNVRRIVTGSDTSKDPKGPGAIYITDGIWKRHIGTMPQVNITFFADFAEHNNGKPYVLDQAWLNAIPIVK